MSSGKKFFEVKNEGGRTGHRVLSLLQPWASLVIMSAKGYEVRSWQTAYRGPVLIHASAKKPARREKLFFEQSEYFKDFIPDMHDLPYGAIIGATALTAIYRTEWLLQNLESEDKRDWQQEFAFDDYSPDRYVWKLEEARPLKYNLPMRGTLGLWYYDGLIE